MTELLIPGLLIVAFVVIAGIIYWDSRTTERRCDERTARLDAWEKQLTAREARINENKLRGIYRWPDIELKGSNVDFETTIFRDNLLD